mmetsp:Transcript_32605/g.103244  ORF Transcript_32605/g.103244 Transcript_32605/m.103244 type:complete len:630 (-) Transcript_32605:152-2041(-)
MDVSGPNMSLTTTVLIVLSCLGLISAGQSCQGRMMSTARPAHRMSLHRLDPLLSLPLLSRTTITLRGGSDRIGEDQEDSEPQDARIERRAWFLRAFCCCFCGQWQMLSAQQRERQQKLEREEEAVRKIAELYGQMFANTRFEWSHVLAGGVKVAAEMERQLVSKLNQVMRNTVLNAGAVLFPDPTSVWRIFDENFTLDIDLDIFPDAASNESMSEVPSDDKSIYVCSNSTCEGNCSNQSQDNTILGGNPSELTESPEFFKDLEQWLSFAIAVYGWKMLSLIQPHEFHRHTKFRFDDLTSFCSYSNVHPSLILQHRGSAETFAPAYIVFRHPPSDSIVVAVRGSFEAGDILTDLVACSSPFQDRSNRCRGHVHMGIFRAAEEICSQIRQTILSSLIKGEGSRIVFTGHSLGAGVAAIMVAIFKFCERDRRLSCADIRAFCFACPPVMDMELAKTVRHQIVTCIAGDDVVSRLSYRSIKTMKSAVLKPILELQSKGQRDLGEDLSQNKTLSQEVEEMIMDSEAANMEAHPLLVPGMIFALRPAPDTDARRRGGSRRCSSLCSCLPCSSFSHAFSRDSECYFMQSLEPTDPYLVDIVLSERMFLDHFPSVIQHRLRWLKRDRSFSPCSRIYS